MQMDRRSNDDTLPPKLPTALPLSVLHAIQQLEDGVRQRRVQLVVIPHDLNHHEGLSSERVCDYVNEQRQSICLLRILSSHSRTARTVQGLRRSPPARLPSTCHAYDLQPLRSRSWSPPSSREATARSYRIRTESSAGTASAPPAALRGRPEGSPRPRRTPG